VNRAVVKGRDHFRKRQGLEVHIADANAAWTQHLVEHPFRCHALGVHGTGLALQVRYGLEASGVNLRLAHHKIIFRV
jgi:hypothetical protein